MFSACAAETARRPVRLYQVGRKRDDVGSLTEAVIGSAIAVHRALGPGLLESAYRRCLAYELAQRRVRCAEEVELGLSYRGLVVPGAYRIDLLVENRVIVEVKGVARLTEVHVAQVATYLRLSGCRVGLLVNFHVPRLVDGVRRVVR